MDRFFNSARLLNINLGFTKEYLRDLLNELVQKLDDDELFVYWQATRGGNALRSHNYDKEQKANLWITICPEKITDKETWACQICGYIYEGDLTKEPEDFVCPICKQPKSMFKKQ